jgi:ubiquitin-conjugating enzyme E2 W
LNRWNINVTGAPDTIYQNENFILRFKFPERYPFESPAVMFVGSNIPIHPHIYSNGHICLSVLAEEWSPALSAQSICLSIISMLSSCKEKVRPPDDQRYVSRCADPNDPKKTRWEFHDDKV